MGCSNNIEIEGEGDVEEMLMRKEIIIGKYEGNKAKIEEDDLTQMVRIDIDITEKIEQMNIKLEKKDSPNLRTEITNTVERYEELNERWHMVLSAREKGGDENEQGEEHKQEQQEDQEE